MYAYNILHSEYFHKIHSEIISGVIYNHSISSTEVYPNRFTFINLVFYNYDIFTFELS